MQTIDSKNRKKDIYSSFLIDDNRKSSDTGDDDDFSDGPLSLKQVESFLYEVRMQPGWRKEADKCADYYDGNQLDHETLEDIDDKNVIPIVSNYIKPTIDTVIGIDAKMMSDWVVRPTEDGTCSDDLAEALSMELKKAEQESMADWAFHEANSAKFKAGLGWVEVSSERDPFKCPYRVDYVHRREISWDWRSTKPDLSDAKYLIRRRWIDLDEAIAKMPEFAELFKQTVNSWHGFDPLAVNPEIKLYQSFQIERDTKIFAQDWRDSERKRVCLYEIWYRKWVRAHIIQLKNGKSIEVDFSNPKHTMAIMSGAVKTRLATFQKVRLAWFCGPHFLYDVPSPYKHGRFPYVPLFCFREDQTNAPYGMVRPMISPQDEINSMKAKLNWMLKNRVVITDSDSVEDHVQTAAEVSRHDAYIILNKERSPNSRFEINSVNDVPPQMAALLEITKQEISDNSGVHKTMMGKGVSGTSGFAVNSLAEQGDNTLAGVRRVTIQARKIIGEMLFELLLDNMAGKQTIIEIGEGKNKKQVPINMPYTDPETGETTIINDTSKISAKVVVDDIPSSPSFRMQQLQTLTGVAASLPDDMKVLLADYIVESTDMPNRFEAAERIREALGIKDEEQQQAENEQMKQEKQKAEKLAMRMAALDAAKKAAEIRQINAKANQILNDTNRSNQLATESNID